MADDHLYAKFDLLPPEAAGKDPHLAFNQALSDPDHSHHQQVLPQLRSMGASDAEIAEIRQRAEQENDD